MISVVCPFYNEAAIIASVIGQMVQTLRGLDEPWELIVVDDGSTDDSRALARSAAEGVPEVRVLGYDVNRGRGHAIRTGAAQARGEIIVTTEIDLSWGTDIVERLVRALQGSEGLDMVIASPHLSGGGYRNVPARRVFLSRWGNRLLRLTANDKVTMFTGMTRAYKAAAFRALPLEENGKELHLEIVRKALALGYRIGEIPAVLEWKTQKSGAPRRKSSSRIPKLIRSHLLFSLAAAPFRVLIPLGLLAGALSVPFLILAFINLFREDPSAFYLLTAMLLALLAVVILGLSALSLQASNLQEDIWRIRAAMNASDPGGPEEEREGGSRGPPRSAD